VPFETLVQFRELRRPVTPRLPSSVHHGNFKYVALLPSGLRRIGESRIDGGEVCKSHQSGPFHSTRSPGARRHSPSGRRRERRPPLIQFAHSPQSILFVPLRVSSDARHAASLEFCWRSVLELLDCRPSGRWRASQATLRLIAPFVRMREFRRPVTPPHRRSVPMGTPTTWRDCSLRSGALERIELMLGNCANRIRACPFHSIRSSVNRRHSQTGRWGVRRPALSRFTPSPKFNSVRSNAGELRRPSHPVVGVQLENRL
jgi:hypothetical protein